MTLNESLETFRLTDRAYADLFEIVEGLIACYCYAEGKQFIDYTVRAYDNVRINEQIAHLIREHVRIPTRWSDKDCEALDRLIDYMHFRENLFQVPKIKKGD